MEKWELDLDGNDIKRNGKLIAHIYGQTQLEVLATANLIVTAVNACIEVNPENPLAAAETHKDLYEVCKGFESIVRFFNKALTQKHTDSEIVAYLDGALDAEGAKLEQVLAKTEVK